jgi:crAss001_48 related protein
MEAFQERVVTEKKELDEKIEKLYAFIHGTVYPSLPDDERARLMRQYCHMKDYSNVLLDRIVHFVGFEPKIGAVGGFQG